MNDNKIKLNNGLSMPIIGFGAYKLREGDETEKAIGWALSAGYRLIDTAMIYENEKSVGKAINNSGIRREEIFLTTKLWNEDQGYQSTLRAIDDSLNRLGLEYVDLYLIHWPSADEDRYKTVNRRAETWKAMEEIYQSGKAKSIGVSNYLIRHLQEMKEYAKITPVVNQVEFHPFLFQKELLDYCVKNNMVLEAYSPLVKGRKMDNEVIQQIANNHDKTYAQILLRWSIQHRCVPIPKSSKQDRIKENLQVFDFKLSSEEMAKIDSLDEKTHQAWDPTEID